MAVLMSDTLIQGTFQRGATADLTLPDGTFIPKGTKLEVNTASIHVDDQEYENPHQFDGLRYYKMRQRSGEENKHLYYSVGKNDLSFGYGRHACPGRYLGHLNIKLILAELLTRYDIQLIPGQSRAKNYDFEALVSDNNFCSIIYPDGLLYSFSFWLSFLELMAYSLLRMPNTRS